MDTPESNFIEIVLGGILLGLGLLYLSAQFTTTDKLNKIAIERELASDHLYQQSDFNVNLPIPTEELYTVLMGYREYTISIDGTVITPDSIDITSYMSLVKEGYYTKEYVYNETQDIKMIVYTYNGRGM